MTGPNVTTSVNVLQVQAAAFSDVCRSTASATASRNAATALISSGVCVVAMKLVAGFVCNCDSVFTAVSNGGRSHIGGSGVPVPVELLVVDRR